MITGSSSASIPEESLAALQQEVQQNLEQLKPNVMLETMKGWIPGLIAFGIKLLIALAIFAVGSRVIKIIYHMLNRSFTRMDMEISLRKFLLSVLNATMYCLLGFHCGAAGIGQYRRRPCRPGKPGELCRRGIDPDDETIPGW